MVITQAQLSLRLCFLFPGKAQEMLSLLANLLSGGGGMPKRFLIMMALILIISFALSPLVVWADSTPIDGEELTIAFLPRSLGNPIFLDAFEAAQKKAHELGVRLEWVAPFDFDSGAQVEIMENLIRRQVDGIIASVNDEEPVRQVINEALDPKGYGSRDRRSHL